MKLPVNHLDVILLELLNGNVLNYRLWRLIVHVLVEVHLFISLHELFFEILSSILQHHFLTVCVNVEYHFLPFG